MSFSDEVEKIQKGWEPDPLGQSIPDFLKRPEIKIMDDPWKHRNQGMRCKSCMWFVSKEKNVGRCRRHAPTLSGYPVVFDSDWCGDHKLDETKATL